MQLPTWRLVVQTPHTTSWLSQDTIEITCYAPTNKLIEGTVRILRTRSTPCNFINSSTQIIMETAMLSG